MNKKPNLQPIAEAYLRSFPLENLSETEDLEVKQKEKDTWKAVSPLSKGEEAKLTFSQLSTSEPLFLSKNDRKSYEAAAIIQHTIAFLT